MPENRHWDVLCAPRFCMRKKAIAAMFMLKSRRKLPEKREFVQFYIIKMRAVRYLFNMYRVK